MAWSLQQKAFDQRYSAAPEAVNDALEAREIFRRLGDRRGERAALTTLGLAASRHDPRQAVASFESALEVAMEIADHRGHALSLDHLANLHANEGRLQVAERMFEEALGLARTIENPKLEAVSRFFLGDLRGRLGEVERAREDLTAALSRFSELGEKGVAMTLCRLLTLELASGFLEPTDGRLAELRRLEREGGDPWIRPRHAEEALRERADEYAAAPPVLQARAAWIRARALLEQGRTAAARRTLDAAAPLFETLEDVPVRLEARLVRARLELADGQPRLAAGILTGVVEESGRLGLELLRREAATLLETAWET